MTGARVPVPSVSVEAIGIEHLAAVDEIMTAAFDAAFGEAWNSAQVLATLALPGYQLRGGFLACPEPSLVGFSITRTVARESELLLLGVHPKWRRSGVATALLNDWLSRCQRGGVGLAFLEMRQDNPARALYKGFGFSEVAVRSCYYRGGDGVLRDAVTMNKMVTESL